MTQLATSETVLADFDDVHLTLNNQPYDLERRGEEYWVKMPDPAWLLRAQGNPDDPAIPAQLPRVERRIVMTTGSHHMQTYWVSAKPGNLLFSFPFTYVREADRWVPSDETFLRPPGPPQIEFWNNVCIKCHCVGGQPGLDRPTQSLNTRVAELGISCEACHGPGEEHVRRNLNPSRRYGNRLGGEPDPTIVNPVHLDSRRSAEVCGQCHAATAPRNVSSWYRTGYPYRAGDELAKTRIIVRHPVNAAMPELDRLLKEAPTFLEDRFWSDGMIRLSGREYNGLIESPCYQRGELNCLSCHASHASDPDDQLAAKMNTDEACFQCHSAFRDRVEAHTHHPPDSSGSHCYNCHMPHTMYGLLKAERSHEIDSPTVAASIQTGRPNACNLCHLDQTLAWAAEHLTEWYGTPPVELSDEQRSISAAILWILKGDAGQWALLAWHMEWAPALECIGA